MKSYSPSINILNDHSGDYNYVPTVNGLKTYTALSKNFELGLRSFNLVGSYGTGKSAFLVALERQLNKKSLYYDIDSEDAFEDYDSFEFINVLGDFSSLTNCLAEALNTNSTQEAVYTEIKTRSRKLRKENKCLALIIDEFGKVLEYSVKNNPEKELYFIQKIAEYVNNSDRNILFVTTLHQNIDAYGLSLSEKDRLEWEKIKGRIRELPFNEPLDQLLDLAASVIKDQFDQKILPTLSSGTLAAIKSCNLFQLKPHIDSSLVSALKPLDPISASTLLYSLQKYGQNERSLFGFLQSKESKGINDFLESNQLQYGVHHVYDYLVYNFSSSIFSRYNPDYFHWRLIKQCLDRAELLSHELLATFNAVIKSIGLLSTSTSSASRITKDFLCSYLSDYSFDGVTDVLALLESKSIVKFHAYKGSYTLYEGSDIDIEKLIEEYRLTISHVKYPISEIASLLGNEKVLAKRVTYELGTPRVFKFEVTRDPILQHNTKNNAIDGIINVLLGEDVNLDELTANTEEPIIYCHLSNLTAINDNIWEINILEQILKDGGLDKVARQELIDYLSVVKDTARDLIYQNVIGDNSTWVCLGEKLNISSRAELNKKLSEVCEDVYSSTPRFRNELLNRTKVSSSIHHAKKKYIENLINSYDRIDLGFEKSKFPAEKTIYYSLLKDSGLHSPRSKNEKFKKDVKRGHTLDKLWEYSEEFLELTVEKRRSISDFIDLLRQPPFGLKDGLIEFWIISYLFIKRKEYALYFEDRYIPTLNQEILELLFKQSSKIRIKAFKIENEKLDIFNQYLALTKKEIRKTVGVAEFQSMAKPYMVLYKELSQYAKNTGNNISKEGIRLRETLKNARDLEQTFFKDIPRVFGLNLAELTSSKDILSSFAEKLNSTIKELLRLDDGLRDRFKRELSEYLGISSSSYEEIKEKLINRFRTSNSSILPQDQRSLLLRISSPIDSEEGYFNSLAHGLTGKKLSEFTDDDENRLYYYLHQKFRDLEKAVEISTVKMEEGEIAYNFELTSSEQELIKQQVILSKMHQARIIDLTKELEGITKDLDNNVKTGLYLNLLKELLK